MKTKPIKFFLLFCLIELFAGLGLLQAQGTLERTQYGTAEGPEPPPNRECISSETVFCGTLYTWTEQLIMTPTFSYTTFDNVVAQVSAPAGLTAYVQNMHISYVDPKIEADPKDFVPWTMSLPFTVGPAQYSSTGKLYLYLEFVIELCGYSEPVAFGNYEFDITINGTQYSADPDANPDEEGDGESGEGDTFEVLGAPSFTLPFSISTTYNVAMVDEECVDETGAKYPELIPLGPNTNRFGSISTESKEAFHLYPNPSNSNSILNLSVQEEGKYTVKILDINGKLLNTPLKSKNLEAGEHDFKLDLSALSPGLYLIQVESKESISTRKLLKY